MRLAYRDFGGDGPPMLLLHGLAGHAEEWAQTASWLSASRRVFATDARGHGRSERLPADVSRVALVADAACVVESLGLGPVVVVGQSLGGLVALCLASSRRELVRGLVVADASPDGGPEEADAAARAMRAALRAWPVPFRSLDERSGSSEIASVLSSRLGRGYAGWSTARAAGGRASTST